jgi:hypothetical protein
MGELNRAVTTAHRAASDAHRPGPSVPGGGRVPGQRRHPPAILVEETYRLYGSAAQPRSTLHLSADCAPRIRPTGRSVRAELSDPARSMDPLCLRCAILPLLSDLTAGLAPDRLLMVDDPEPHQPAGSVPGSLSGDLLEQETSRSQVLVARALLRRARVAGRVSHTGRSVLWAAVPELAGEVVLRALSGVLLALPTLGDHAMGPEELGWVSSTAVALVGSPTEVDAGELGRAIDDALGLWCLRIR